MAITPIQIKGRQLPFPKPIVRPAFGVKTVLTNSPWTFVSLWLKRNKKTEALFYWEQAQHFYNASIGLPMQSAPLLLYYSFMNATKALLSAKSISFNPMHGVKAKPINPNSGKTRITNEGIEILNHGIVPALSTYFLEPETQKKHSLSELLFNLSFIHRTFCLTRKSQHEMFLPLRGCAYVFDSTTKEVHFEAEFASDVTRLNLARRLPSSIIQNQSKSKLAIKSSSSIPWASSRPSETELNALYDFHRTLRLDIHYISGSLTLWYLKTKVRGYRRLLRYSPTLVLSAMHRLSEICRYKPKDLSSYLDGPSTWLLSEFISMSPFQFLDEIASEITGHQFLVPNVRNPI